MLLESEKTVAISPAIFRKYDIRGIAGNTLTEEGMFFIGKAIASVVREKNQREIALAHDGRLSSPVLSNALCKGMLAAGCDVYDYGMAPTPILYYAAHNTQSRSGVMVTGSHNPPEYNGVKIVIDGITLAENDIQNLYQRIVAEKFQEGYGKRYNLSIIEKYVTQITENINLKRPLKIVIDAGNGVTGLIAPKLFKSLGCEVTELFCQVDGTFPNHEADPGQIENLQDLRRKVMEVNADIGLAFDGDGDRLGVVTNQGEIIWPDRLLMLFARDLLQHIPQAKIIFDVKCTSHLHDLIRDLGGEPIMWKTGHSLIKAKLAETNAALAGEMSGHFFFKDRWFGFDDALYAGARLLEILATEANCIDIFSTIPNSINTPELRIAVPDEEKFPLMQRLMAQANFAYAKDVVDIDGIRVNFAEGWGLLRASNTSPNLILRFEALDQTILENIQAVFRKWILQVQPNLVLPF